MSLDFDPIAEAERQWRAHRWTDTASAMAAVTSCGSKAPSSSGRTRGCNPESTAMAASS